MYGLQTPPDLEEWPVEEQVNWFVASIGRERTLEVFRREIGIDDTSNRSPRVTVKEMGRAVEVLTNGEEVIPITVDRDGCLRYFREAIGGDPENGTRRVRKDELARFLIINSMR